MPQKSLKHFFRGNVSRNDNKRQKSDISKSTSWKDVDESQKAGIQKTGRSSINSPDGVCDLSDSPIFRQPPVVLHSSIAMMVKKENTTRNVAPNGASADQAMKTEESLQDIINLSSKQNDVLNSIMQGKSVFFTGAAGTGKSHILRVLRRVMDHLKRSDDIAFTAPTGVAACNIRGLTVHSWAGIGLGNEPVDTLAARITRNKNAKKRWENVKILVIDEISMLSAELFDVLSTVATRVRLDERPFGGIQLILCGDFFQLPPVGLGSSTHLCFKAKSWQSLFHSTGNQSGDQCLYVLDKVFRQRDSDFLGMLHEVRRGEVSEATRKRLTKKVAEDYRRERERKLRLENMNTASLSQMSAAEAASAAIKPTKLFGKNVDVDRVNVEELAQIHDREYTYMAADEGNEKHLKQLRNGTKIPETITLKIGAQVMLLKNLDTAKGLVNGARGIVVDFEKSQGRSVIFQNILPVVDFVVNLGDGPDVVERRVLVEESSDIKEGDKVLASRSQLPLMLAYAITIHKSQGMTIPHLEISFRGIFEYGQAYVALSRATNLPGLILKTFDANAIKAHPEVKQFYQKLGYTGESEHQDTATIATSVLLLAELYLRCCGDLAGGGGSSHHAVYARAPPQTSDWIVSKQEKAQKKRKRTVGVSLYEASETAQLRATTTTTTTANATSGNTNRFSHFDYDEDTFMESNRPIHRNRSKTGAEPPHHPPLPRGLEKTLEPFVVTQPLLKFSGSGVDNGHGSERQEQHIQVQEEPWYDGSSVAAQGSNRTTGSDGASAGAGLSDMKRTVPGMAKSGISDEQRRKIEANRIAAQERMKANRQKQDEEKERLLDEFYV